MLVSVVSLLLFYIINVESFSQSLVRYSLPGLSKRVNINNDRIRGILYNNNNKLEELSNPSSVSSEEIVSINNYDNNNRKNVNFTLFTLLSALAVTISYADRSNLSTAMYAYHYS